MFYVYNKTKNVQQLDSLFSRQSMVIKAQINVVIYTSSVHIL